MRRTLLEVGGVYVSLAEVVGIEPRYADAPWWSFGGGARIDGCWIHIGHGQALLSTASAQEAYSAIHAEINRRYDEAEAAAEAFHARTRASLTGSFSS